jgi:hypothetical protein
MPASLHPVAAPLALRGMRLGGTSEPLVEGVNPLVLDVEPLVIDAGRRFSNHKRLVVWVDRLVVRVDRLVVRGYRPAASVTGQTRSMGNR